MGHPLKKVMRVVAEQQERAPVEVAKEAGAELICGSSLKERWIAIGINKSRKMRRWHWS
ncbi:hypothetical protein KSD_57270 [Ktedonobacter sp. SOSP1-85]|nr:hypothetical protein KSD_57270 [Ktedonobacter sp. SOSP1-85]